MGSTSFDVLVTCLWKIFGCVWTDIKIRRSPTKAPLLHNNNLVQVKKVSFEKNPSLKDVSHSVGESHQYSTPTASRQQRRVNFSTFDTTRNFIFHAFHTSYTSDFITVFNLFLFPYPIEIVNSLKHCVAKAKRYLSNQSS